MSVIHPKSDDELAVLRRCGSLVSATLAEVAQHVRPGVKTISLDEVAEAFVRDHGAEPAFKGYRVGSAVYPATLCVSVNDVVVHGIPGEYEIREDDLVSIDCGVVLDGFYGDSAYTIAMAGVDDAVRNLCSATYASLCLGIEAAIVGNRIGDISAAVEDYCRARGFGVVQALVGHGIGKSLHEAPQVPNVGRRGVGRKLKHGMTMCIEPMINLGGAEVRTDDDRWTVRTDDGSPSAHYEHMVAVLRGGSEVLTTFEGIEAVVDVPYHQPATG